MMLRKYLRAQKILYRTFAEELGINEQSLKNIVSGTSRPSLMLALKIEKLTDGLITPSQLVEDFSEKKEKKIRKKR